MKYADIAGLAEQELVKRIKELRKQLFDARMKNALGQLANPMTIRFARRDIARLQTALSAKKLAAKSEANSAKRTVKTRGKAAKSAAKG